MTRFRFFYALLIIACLNEALRILLKGWDHGFSWFNDLWFYRGIRDHYLSGWGIESSALSLPDLIQTRSDIRNYYLGFHSLYLDPINGLHLQPPYCYRILVPFVLAFLGITGLSFITGSLLIQILSVVVIGLITRRLLENSGVEEAPSYLLAMLVAVTFATTSAPGYPDAPAAAFGISALLAAQQGRRTLFAGLLILSVLTRETSLLYAIGVLLQPQPKVAKEIASIVPALMSAIAVRFLFSPISSQYVILDVISERANPQNLILSLSATSLLIPLTRAAAGRPKNFSVENPMRNVLLVVLISLFSSAFLSLLATNISRMSLLMLPVLLTACRAGNSTSGVWTAISAAGLIAFSICDQIQDLTGATEQWIATSLAIIAATVVQGTRDLRRAHHSSCDRVDTHR